MTVAYKAAVRRENTNGNSAKTWFGIIRRNVARTRWFAIIVKFLVSAHDKEVSKFINVRSVGVHLDDRCSRLDFGAKICSARIARADSQHS